MLLAAGRGERMRPLTDACPKPLLKVRDKALLQWHVDALAAAGVRQLLINTAWLGEQIPAYFAAHGVAGMPDIRYSREELDFGGALETAGGILRALPELDDVFWVAAGDVFVPGFSFSTQAMERFRRSGKLAHLWLVPNPPHNPKGDFGLVSDGSGGEQERALSHAPQQYTYSTIALFRRAFFTAPWCDIPSGNPAGLKAPLAPMLRAAMDNQQVSAELYTGPWTDVGTPERLAQLNQANHEILTP